MKAVVQDRYGTSEVLELREVERPAIGESDVLIRVHAAGVDPSVWHLMTGKPYAIRLAGYGLRTPKHRIPGTDVAGIVEAVGRGVQDYQPGDRVFGVCDGSFAEYVVAREARVEGIPEALTFEQAAALPVSGTTASQALLKGGVQRGQKVLIIGAGGGVGTYAVQLAKAAGAEVTGVCSTAKLELVRSIGADHVIDYTREDVEDVTKSAQLYDVIIDAAGNRSLRRLRRVLARRGTLVIVGGEGGGPLLGGAGRLVWASLRTVVAGPFGGRRMAGLLSKVEKGDLRRLSGAVQAGDVAPVMDKTFPLSEVAEAIRYVQEGHALGKVVLRVAGD